MKDDIRITSAQCWKPPSANSNVDDQIQINKSINNKYKAGNQETYQQNKTVKRENSRTKNKEHHTRYHDTNLNPMYNNHDGTSSTFLRYPRRRLL